MVLLFSLACGPRTDASPAVDTAQEPACQAPESLLDAVGQPAGFERCADGAVNRTGHWQGELETYADVYGTPWVTGEVECEAHSDCASDERCAQKDLGHCIYTGPRCETVCASDADCGADQVCVPPGVHDGRPEWPTCVAAACKTGADCETGECALIWNPLDVDISLSCRSPEDVCRSNGDCESPYEVYCTLGHCSSDIPCY